MYWLRRECLHVNLSYWSHVPHCTRESRTLHVSLPDWFRSLVNTCHHFLVVHLLHAFTINFQNEISCQSVKKKNETSSNRWTGKKKERKALKKRLRELFSAEFYVSNLGLQGFLGFFVLFYFALRLKPWICISKCAQGECKVKSMCHIGSPGLSPAM